MAQSICAVEATSIWDAEHHPLCTSRKAFFEEEEAITTVRIADHLPPRLTVPLWDFSWFTQTMPGEPLADVDRAFAEAQNR